MGTQTQPIRLRHGGTKIRARTEVQQEIHKEPQRGSKSKSALACPAIVSPSHRFLAVRDCFVNAAFLNCHWAKMRTGISEALP